MSVDLRPALSDDENDLLNHLIDQLNQRKPRNLLRSSFYDGRKAVSQVGSVIPPEYVRSATVLGWAGKAVDILARRCNLDGFVWPDGDLAALGYQDLWEANFLAAETNSAVVSSLIHGVAFLVNTAGGVGEPDSLIHVKDALHATGDMNPRTRRLDNLLSVMAWDEHGNPTSFALYLDGETVTAEKDGGWSVERSSHPWGIPAEALVYKPWAGRIYGSSRISRPVMSLHMRAVKVCIRMETTADIYSIPQWILLGANESAFKNADGSLKPSWKIALGRVFALPDDDEAPVELARADFKVVQAATPQPHIDMLKQTAQQFSGETHIPLSSLGVSDMSNPTSADSYIASREDLIAEAEGATDDWSPAFRRCIRRALAIQNNEKDPPQEWSSITAKWRSPVYLSRAAQADAGMKQLTAVPWLAETSIGLELLGLNDQQIAAAMAERRRAGGRQLLKALTQPVAAGSGDGTGSAATTATS